MSNREGLNYFMYSSPYKILLEIDNTKDRQIYVQLLSKKTDITYSHVNNILNKFHEMGLVQSQREGRKLNLVLTKKGQEVMLLIRKMKGLLSKDAKD